MVLLYPGTIRVQTSRAAVYAVKAVFGSLAGWFEPLTTLKAKDSGLTIVLI